LRVFASRASTGVRGIKLVSGDEVVSLALLRHTDITVAEANAYLKQANAARRAATGEEEGSPEESDEVEGSAEEATLSTERYAELGAREQFVLIVTTGGMGKRTSAYEYRVMGRGNQGTWAMSKKSADIVASFRVEESDDIMLVSDAGQIIRVPVSQIGIKGRATQGVTLFRVEENERVVSVERIEEAAEDGE